jgi:ankyrin repeat protein
VVNNVDPNRNTALHIASIHVHIKIVQFLLRYYVSRTIKNKNEFTAEEIASNEEMKNLFKATIGRNPNSEH